MNIQRVYKLHHTKIVTFKLLRTSNLNVTVEYVSIPEPSLIDLGLTIARARRDLGMSIDRLSEGSGVHRKSIIQIEAGRVSARITTLHAIAHALGVPLTELVAPVCVHHRESISVPTKLV